MISGHQSGGSFIRLKYGQTKVRDGFQSSRGSKVKFNFSEKAEIGVVQLLFYFFCQPLSHKMLKGPCDLQHKQCSSAAYYWVESKVGSMHRYIRYISMYRVERYRIDQHFQFVLRYAKMREHEWDLISRPSAWQSNALTTRPRGLLMPGQNLSGMIQAFELLLW